MNIRTEIGLVVAAWLSVGGLYAESPPGLNIERPDLSGITAPLVLSFDYGRADLQVSRFREKDFASLAQEMKNYPNAKLEIDGFADISGRKAENLKLSESRAVAVRDHFVQLYGIPANRMVIRGFGVGRPAASNATIEGREVNRRAIARVYRLNPSRSGWGQPAL